MLVRFGLAALCGLLTFAAFPGIGAWPLAFVAWVPLLLALEDVTVKQGAALGFVAGLFAALPGFRFLYPVLRNESGLDPLPCAAIVLAVALYHALRGLTVGVLSRALSRSTDPPSLSFAAGLAASELAIPSLFPWFFGASVHNVPILLQSAELLGPASVSLALAMSSVAFAETISALRKGRRTRPHVIVPALAIPIAAAFWGSIRIPVIDAQTRSADAITVGVVQPNLARGGEIETIERHRTETRALVTKGAQLVVWAEGALPWTVPSPFIDETFSMLRMPDVPIVTGALIQDDASSRVTNSALLFEKGHLKGRYDKIHLLPFAETLPLSDTFPSLRDLSPQSGHFAAGSSYAPLRLGDHALAVFICYEDLFPGHVRAITKSGDTDLLVNLTNDSWFAGTDEPRVHLALAKLRAVEQRKYLVRATLTGKSAIVDPTGRLLGAIPEDRDGTLLAEVRFLRTTTLYTRLGDLPMWLFIAFVVARSLWLRRRPPKQAPWRPGSTDKEA